jgi:hypothetical protein
VRERLWNQRLRGKRGVRWLLGVNAAVAVWERVENTGGALVVVVPSAPASVKALRCAPPADAALRGPGFCGDLSPKIASRLRHFIPNDCSSLINPPSAK